MGMTATMLKMWLDAVVKPKVTESVRSGVPLVELGKALFGYGVGVLRAGAGWDVAQVRALLEEVLATPQKP